MRVACSVLHVVASILLRLCVECSSDRSVGSWLDVLRFAWCVLRVARCVSRVACQVLCVVLSVALIVCVFVGFYVCLLICSVV